ncbi:phage tail tip lysozyme [Pararoseomonas sp. SCSIO 73927]|uniref:phage tail tip lysozyme n=1 Tax=Pararoseomonas sp. SCSIO 73927 TaxID=3114537 RepID=UPI0030CE865C
MATASAGALSVAITAQDGYSRPVARMVGSTLQLGGAVKRLGGDIGRGLGLDRLRNQARGVADTIGAIVPPLSAITAAGTITGVYRLADGWARTGAELGRLSQRAGASVRQVASLQAAAKIAGASGEDMAQGLVSLGDAVTDAVGGRDDTAAAYFRMLGIQMRDASGRARGAADILPEVADGLQRIGDPALQARVMGALRLPPGLIPALSGGRRGLRELQAEAERYGATNEEGARAARQFEEAQAKLTLAGQGLANTLAARLAPSMVPLIDGAREWVVTNREWIGLKVGEAVTGMARGFAAVPWTEIGQGIQTVGNGLRWIHENVVSLETVGTVLAGAMAAKWTLAILGLTARVTGLAAAYKAATWAASRLARTSLPAAAAGAAAAAPAAAAAAAPAAAGAAGAAAPAVAAGAAGASATAAGLSRPLLLGAGLGAAAAIAAAVAGVERTGQMWRESGAATPEAQAARRGRMGRRGTAGGFYGAEDAREPTPQDDAERGWEAWRQVGERLGMYFGVLNRPERTTGLASGPDRRRAQDDDGAQRRAYGGEEATARQRTAFDRLKGHGWTEEQAAGILANLRHESGRGLDNAAVGDSGKAYGIAQWHPDRQENFRRWAGKPIQGSSLEEQIDFINYELTQGAERRAGNLLRRQTTAAGAGQVTSLYYERPRGRLGEANARGDTAAGMLPQLRGGGAAAAAAPPPASPPPPRSTLPATGTPSPAAAPVGRQQIDLRVRVEGDRPATVTARSEDGQVRVVRPDLGAVP